MAENPKLPPTIKKCESEDRGVIEDPPVLPIRNGEVDLNEISDIATRINNLNIQHDRVSSIQDAIKGIAEAKTTPECTQNGSQSSFVKSNASSPYTASLKSLLAKLEFELSGTEEFLEQLITDRRRLHLDLLSRTSTTNLRNTVQKAAQEKLPVELWAQIFFLCLPNDDFVKPDPRQAPLLLCQISSTWRTVATGTPLLWSTLSIGASWRRYIWKPSLECWLKRSGNAVLYLDVSIPVYMEASFDFDVMDLINSSAHRWHHLRLSMPDNLLRSMLRNQMPELHKLEFSSAYPIATLGIEASQAPKLRVVSLLTKPLYPQPLSLPWQQLESFSSQCWLNMGQHLEILRTCPRLESYSMYLVHADLPPDSKPLEMCHLRNLEIVAFIGDAMGPVLGLLQLPKLTHLSFIVPNESPVCGLADFPNFHVMALVERSSCSLSKICLKGINMPKASIEDMEKCISSIESIDIL